MYQYEDEIKFHDLRVAIYEISSLLADEPNYDNYIQPQLFDLLEAVNSLQNMMEESL